MGSEMCIRDSLYAGIEYQYWNNKFGLGDTLMDDQSSVSALVKFHF